VTRGFFQSLEAGDWWLELTPATAVDPNHRGWGRLHFRRIDRAPLTVDNQSHALGLLADYHSAETLARMAGLEDQRYRRPGQRPSTVGCEVSNYGGAVDVDPADLPELVDRFRNLGTEPEAPAPAGRRTRRR
jgi:hypothetical protein